MEMKSHRCFNPVKTYSYLGNFFSHVSSIDVNAGEFGRPDHTLVYCTSSSSQISRALPSSTRTPPISLVLQRLEYTIIIIIIIVRLPERIVVILLQKPNPDISSGVLEQTSNILPLSNPVVYPLQTIRRVWPYLQCRGSNHPRWPQRSLH